MSDHTTLFNEFLGKLSGPAEPKKVRTMRELPFDTNEIRFDTGEVITERGVSPSCVVSIFREGASITGQATREDLLKIAEHCVIRANQFKATSDVNDQEK